jgi:hypothetical protein
MIICERGSVSSETFEDFFLGIGYLILMVFNHATRQFFQKVLQNFSSYGIGNFLGINRYIVPWQELSGQEL